MKTPVLIAGLVLSPALAFADDPPSAPAPDAVAEEPVPEPPPPPVDASYGEEITVSDAGSVRSFSSQWLIMPRGWEASGELQFLTADAPPGGTRTKLTDVVVSHASLRKSIHGRAEIGAGVDLLPKQTGTDEDVWEGANFDLKLGFKTKWAFDAAMAVGPLSDGDGLWTSSGGNIDRRSIVHDTLSFQYGVGAGYTSINGKMSERAGLFEVVAHAKTLFQIQDAFGLWFGADMGFPLSHSGKLAGGLAFDPQTRVDVDVGTVYSLVDNWDVYLQAAIVDRGDLASPATELPILEGGSDQKVLTFGITRHFGEEHEDQGTYDEMALE